MRGTQLTGRSVAVILIVAAIEVAWALYCAINYHVSIGLFYGVLIAASFSFFVPGLLEKRSTVR